MTLACNLRCTHCYAGAGAPRGGTVSATELARITREAALAGFRHLVITGGEPLVHPQREDLLDALAMVRAEVKPLLTVYRTSLAVPLDGDLLVLLSRSTDELVVSIDGDRETHEARRGAGTYELTVSNLRALARVRGTTDISIATVLPLADTAGAPGESVRALARELGIRRIRFRPLLPLGRAIDSELDVLPETQWGSVDPADMVSYGFSPTASCGLGQNLHVEPDLRAYSCYARLGEDHILGSIGSEGGVRGVLDSPAFRDIGRHTVETNRACRLCSLRYLCGGACRAWSGAVAATDVDAPPIDCSALHSRARSLLLSALDHLGVGRDAWLAASLPLPDAPPSVSD